MNQSDEPTCTAFVGVKRVAFGTLDDVASEVKAVLDRDASAQPLIFDDSSSRVIELDFRGTKDDVFRRMHPGPAEVPERGDSTNAAAANVSPPATVTAARPGATGGAVGDAAGDALVEQPARRPGRPKLGVVAREVTLLPRHWDWLAGQPGGASVALRALVDRARRANEGKDRLREAQDAAYRFMSAMGGNEHGFEDAIRALFAGDRTQFDIAVERWPEDVREHAQKLAALVFERSER
jgi:hypothetical protein